MKEEFNGNVKAQFDGQDVWFGPLSQNPGGLSSNRQAGDKKPTRDTVWVTNTKGNDMTMLHTLDTAKYLVNRAGNKFRYATREEIPYTPREKVYPHDPNKTISAQEQANVEMTGREVRELSQNGVDPMDGAISYKEMRAIAKENGIKTHAVKKKDLAAKLREEGLIK